MPHVRLVLIVLLSLGGLLAAAEKPTAFSATLTADQKRALGLADATPAQLAALDAAVEAYRARTESTAVKQAAVDAVAEYREKQEPQVVAAALAAAPAVPPATAPRGNEPERFTANLVGPFEGWSGRTVFTLDNGQVWKQAAQDTYYPKARTNVAVAIYKSPSGHWRLRVLDDEGAWVTVKRLK